MGLALLAVAIVQEPDAPIEVLRVATPTPLPSATLTPTPEAKVRTGTALDVRLGPGEAFAVIGLLPGGETLEVVGRDAAAEWLAIRFPPGSAGRGWVPVDGVVGLTRVEALAVVLPTPLSRAVVTLTVDLPAVTQTAESEQTLTPTAGASGRPDLVVMSISLLPDGRVEVVIGNSGPGELVDLSIFVRVSNLASQAELLISLPVRLGAGGTIALETTTFRVLTETEIQARVDPFASTPDVDRSNNFLQVKLTPPPTPTPTPTLTSDPLD